MRATPTREQNIVSLDVRAMQESKNDPFEVIMETLEQMSSEDQLILYAIFNPEPLLKVMKKKGFSSQSEQLGEKHWKIIFVREQ